MDFLKDFLFWAALLSLVYNFAKLIRDSHHKKLKLWMWFLEIGILVFILFALTFGTYTKYQRDQMKEKQASDRFDLSEARADRREKKLEAVIQQKDRTIETQKQIIQADNKPNIVMEPTSQSENPHLERINDDTIRFIAYFQNIGSASAQSFHATYHFISSDKDENPIQYLAKKGDELGQESKIPPRGLESGIRQLGKVKLPKSLDKNILVCVTYAYKDSLHRPYGPFHVMYEWYYDMPEIGSALANEKASGKAKEFFKKQGLWIDKMF